jgi:hypothetical protein
MRRNCEQDIALMTKIKKKTFGEDISTDLDINREKHSAILKN